MKQNKLPKKPIEPLAPTKTIKISKGFSLYDLFSAVNSLSINDFMHLLKEKLKKFGNVSLDDCIIEYGLGQDDYSSDYLYVSFEEETVNTNYDREFKRYEKSFKIYQEKKKQYDKKLEEYNKNKAEYDKAAKENTIKRLEKELAKLRKETGK